MPEIEATTPNPGSEAAIERGCVCPVLDNGHGAGHLGDGETYGWWRNGACPLHGAGVAEGEHG